MTADNRPEIVLDGNVAPFRQKMREAGDALKQLGQDAEKSIDRVVGPLDALQKKFVAIGALLAGGTVFKEAVTQAAQAAEESLKFGRALGVSASEAHILREALTAGNTSQEEFLGAAKGMAKQLRENEGALQGMGLKTRDAAGQLRPLNDLVLEGIEVTNRYRAGTDRAIAQQTMFGKGFEMTSNLAEMNNKALAEVAEQMRELGIVVSEESVAAWKAYDDAGDKATLTVKGVTIAIGNGLLPVLTDLNNALASNGQGFVRWATLATEAVLGLLDGLKLVKQAFVSVGSDIGAFFAAFSAGVFGSEKDVDRIWAARFEDFAKEELRMKDLWEGTGNSLLGRFRALSAARQETSAAPKTGGKSAAGLLKTEETKKTEEPSFMPVYEARLAELKNVYEQENVLRQFSKEQELAYWRDLQQNYNLTSKDRLAIAKRTATLELEIRRESAKEQRALDAQMIDSRRADALAQIALGEQQAGFARENEAITQRELIAMQEAFARRRFEIEYQALMERLELAKTDPNTSPAELARIKEQLLEVERSYLLRRGELQQAVLVEERSLWNSFTSTVAGLWDKGINAMMNGTLTWRNAWRAILTEMTGWFATEVVGKQVKQWVAGQAQLLAAKLGFMKADEAASIASSARLVANKATETTANVAGDAAQAGAGAAKSQAGIPIVGPWMALAAMATVFAAVMALSKRKSAAGGFDIPKGLNPLTQLHEEEMVLPAQYANVIRGMAGGEGEGGGASAQPVVLNFNSAYQDRAGIRRLLMDNSPALADAIRKAVRNANL